MAFARRIFFFLLTNMAVLLLMGVVFRVLGVDRALYTQTGINYAGLLIFAAMFGFIGSFISLGLSKRMALWSTKARILSEPRGSTEIWLVKTVQTLAQQANIGMPDVAVYDSPSPNAFATGARRNHALVAVSTGLLSAMDRREVEAVLAHEVAHVANGDMITMSLLQGVLNTFVIFLSRIVGMVVDNALNRGEGRRGGFRMGYWITVMAAEVFFGMLASVIAMWYSRRREFRADAGAAKMVGAGGMIAALRALQSAHQPAVLPQSLAAFGIRGGGGRFAALLSSHPPLEDRIRALEAGTGQ